MRPGPRRQGVSHTRRRVGCTQGRTATRSTWRRARTGEPQGGRAATGCGTASRSIGKRRAMPGMSDSFPATVAHHPGRRSPAEHARADGLPSRPPRPPAPPTQGAGQQLPLGEQRQARTRATTGAAMPRGNTTRGNASDEPRGRQRGARRRPGRMTPGGRGVTARQEREGGPTHGMPACRRATPRAAPGRGASLVEAVTVPGGRDRLGGNAPGERACETTERVCPVGRSRSASGYPTAA